jgi:NADH:ubiquinone oxidoreductase subunit B-like Fe-S oxidoreductase
VIAVGSCTLSGGPFRSSPEVSEGLDKLLPVDLFIPGCPPHPLTNLHALLKFFKWDPARLIADAEPFFFDTCF